MKNNELSLRLIQVLIQLFESGSVSRAADALESSQPQVSNDLNRLRSIYDDELFIRKNNKMAATPRCKQIVQRLKRADDAITSTLAAPTGKLTQLEENLSLRIAFDEQSMNNLMPLVVSQLSSLSNRLNLSLENLEMEPNLASCKLLKNGLWDAVISRHSLDDTALINQVILQDEWVIVCSQLRSQESPELKNLPLCFCSELQTGSGDYIIKNHDNSIETPNLMSVLTLTSKGICQGLVPLSVFSEFKDIFKLSLIAFTNIKQPLYYTSHVDNLSEKNKLLDFAIKQASKQIEAHRRHTLKTIPAREAVVNLSA